MFTYYQNAFQSLQAIVDNAKHDIPVGRLMIELAQRPQALDLATINGHWGEHPKLESGRSISEKAWVSEVVSGDTRLGYWDWVVKRLREDADTAP